MNENAMWRGMAYKMHEAARKNMEIMPLLCRCENAMWQGVAHKTREAARKSREIRHSHPVSSKPSASSVRLYVEKVPILCASE